MCASLQKVPIEAPVAVATEPIAKSLRYRVELNGVRCVAVLMVIIYHAGFEWLPGGYLGVDIFFVRTSNRQRAVYLEFQERGTKQTPSYWRTFLFSPAISSPASSIMIYKQERSALLTSTREEFDVFCPRCSWPYLALYHLVSGGWRRTACAVMPTVRYLRE